jgi:hypothetical protein
MGERRFTDPAQRERGNGDAKLCRGQIGIQIVHRTLKGGGIGAARRDKFGNAAAAHGNKGKFCCNEEAIRGYKNENQCDSDQIGNPTAIAVRHDLLSPFAAEPRQACIRGGTRQSCRAASRQDRGLLPSRQAAPETRRGMTSARE